eukprot:tig00001098_g7068.t2
MPGTKRKSDARQCAAGANGDQSASNEQANANVQATANRPLLSETIRIADMQKVRAQKRYLLGLLVSHGKILPGTELKYLGYSCRVQDAKYAGAVQVEERGKRYTWMGPSWAREVYKIVHGTNAKPPLQALQYAELTLEDGRTMTLGKFAKLVYASGDILSRGKRARKSAASPAALPAQEAPPAEAAEGGAGPSGPSSSSSEEEEVLPEGGFSWGEEEEEEGPALVVVKDLAYFASKVPAMEADERAAASAFLDRVKERAAVRIVYLRDLYPSIGCLEDPIRGPLLAVLASGLFRDAVTEGDLLAAIVAELRVNGADYASHPRLPGLAKLARSFLPKKEAAAASATQAIAAALESGARGAEFQRLAEEATLAVIAARLPGLRVDILYRNERKCLAGRSYGATEAPRVVLALAASEAKGRSTYALLRPCAPRAAAAPARVLVPEHEQVEIPGLITWVPADDEATHLPDPQNPGESVLISRLNKEKQAFELWRRCTRSGAEEMVWACRAVYEERLAGAGDVVLPGSSEDQLMRLLHALGLGDASLGGPVEVLRRQMRRLAERVMNSFDRAAASGPDARFFKFFSKEVEKMGDHALALLEGLDELLPLLVQVVGWNGVGKSTLSSGFVYSGMPGPEGFAALAHTVAALAALPHDPAPSLHRYGWAASAGMPARVTAKLERLGEALRAPEAPAVAGLVRGLVETLAARAGADLAAFFMPGSIFPSRTTNATSSVPIATVFSAFLYVVITFITAAEREEAKAAGLAALEEIRAALAEGGGEVRIGMQQHTAVARALAMAGNEHLLSHTPVNGDAPVVPTAGMYAKLRAEHFELPRELQAFERLLGRSVLYFPADTRREEAVQAVQRYLALMTANVKGGCWGLVSSVEVGVPSKSCVGIRLVDGVGATDYDAARREAALVGGPVDVLVHVVLAKDTPKTLFTSLRRPVLDLLTAPEEHGVVIAFDPRYISGVRGETRIKASIAAREPVATSEWESHFAEFEPSSAVQAQGSAPAVSSGGARGAAMRKEAAMKRVSFVSFNAATEYFERLAEKGHAAAAAMEQEKHPEFEAIKQRLEALRREIVPRRLRREVFEAAHSTLCRAMLLFESTVKLRSLSGADRERLKATLADADGCLRRPLEQFREQERLSFEHVWNAVFEKALRGIDRDVLERGKRDTIAHFSSPETLQKAREEFGDLSDDPRRIVRDLDRKQLELSELFNLLLKPFVKAVPAEMGDAIRRALVDGILPGCEETLRAKCSPVLLQRPAALESGDPVEIAAASIIDKYNERLEAEVHGYLYRSVVRDVRAFMEKTIKPAFFRGLRHELADLLAGLRSRLARQAPAGELRLEHVLEAMRRRYRNAPFATYIETLGSVCNQVKKPLRRQFEGLFREIPGGYREVIQEVLEDLGRVAEGALLELSEEKLEQLRKQCEAARLDLDALPELAAAAHCPLPSARERAAKAAAARAAALAGDKAMAGPSGSTRARSQAAAREKGKERETAGGPAPGHAGRSLEAPVPEDAEQEGIQLAGALAYSAADAGATR